MGFFDFRLTGIMVGDDKKGDVMFVFGSKDVIGVRAEAHVFDSQTGFFKHFPHGTIGDGFVELQMTSRKSPRVRPMCVFAFSQQHAIVLDHDNSHTD